MTSTDDGETPPSATVYVRSIDERIKIPALITTLREVFGEYGNIVDVIAKKSYRRKGQAFVVFDSEDSAQTAIDELQGFEIFGKQMHLDFAKTRSDATVLREDNEEGFEAHKQHRLAEKERKQALIEAAEAKPAKRAAAEELAERPAKSTKPAQAAGVVPDEYLPPNKILFLRDLPEDYGQAALTAIFCRFTGFREVRTVPGRPEIAFVEYEDEGGAITAKESTGGMTLGEKAIRVTFQRQ
ncbi:hypothetical protein B0A55_04562 [Friedmanniomyces simplex]|uniref:RRM domain-containing protein n=1 Tax=Friedmanniomyces simplex TaxID=329884 RepID=A0A4U0XKS6_9PEZI|nr:hypothetical protein B0A55_04562 [Friedmanniomyces simplex]